MGKIKYPKFVINRDTTGNKTFIGVINEHFSVVINRAGNFNRKHGFEFNVYTSRQKVIKLERQVQDSDLTAIEFFESANRYMSEELRNVLFKTVQADPLLLSSNIKLLQ